MIQTENTPENFIDTHQDGRARDHAFATVNSDRSLSPTAAGELTKILHAVNHHVDTFSSGVTNDLVTELDDLSVFPTLHVLTRFLPDSQGVLNTARHVQRQLVKRGLDDCYDINGHSEREWGQEFVPFTLYDQSRLLGDQLSVNTQHLDFLGNEAWEAAYQGLRTTLLGDGNTPWKNPYRFARYLTASAALFLSPADIKSNDLLTLLGERLQPSEKDLTVNAEMSEVVKRSVTYQDYREAAKIKGVNAQDIFEIRLSSTLPERRTAHRDAKLALLIADLRHEEKVPMNDDAVLTRLVPFYDCQKTSTDRRRHLATVIRQHVLMPARALTRRL